MPFTNIIPFLPSKSPKEGLDWSKGKWVTVLSRHIQDMGCLWVIFEPGCDRRYIQTHPGVTEGRIPNWRYFYPTLWTQKLPYFSLLASYPCKIASLLLEVDKTLQWM